MNYSDYKLSVFLTPRSGKTGDTTLPEVINDIRNGRFKETVEKHRSLLATNLDEAKRIKDGMMCFIAAGQCVGGHKVSDLKEPSPFMQIDIDHIDNASEVRERLKDIPYMAAGNVSIGGQGVKGFVVVDSDGLQKLDYQEFYAIVAQDVRHRLGVECDLKCKIRTQPCYYSYDPEAWYRETAEAFKIKVLDKSDEQEGLNGLAEADGLKELDAMDEGEIVTKATALLNQFETKDSYVAGNHHDYLVHLGQWLGSRKVGAKVLEKLIGESIVRYQCSGYDAYQIERCIRDGYGWVIEQPDAPLDASKYHGKVSFPYDTFGQAAQSGQPYRTSAGKPYPGNGMAGNGTFGASMAEDEEEVEEFNQQLREEAPFIPDEVYDNLPDFLQRCVIRAEDKRERDFMLMGSACCLSEAFSAVRLGYSSLEYSPHFYFMGTGTAGSGKGVLESTASLLRCIEGYYSKENDRREAEHADAQANWELEQDKARREKRKADVSLKPSLPTLVYPHISANTSKSRLIEHLANAQATGCLMSTSEITTLKGAVGQDYGDFADILLKCFHHEQIDASFKISGKPVHIQTPRLALLLSGTYEQVRSFIRSSENGLLSRFMCLMRDNDVPWKDCMPQDEENDLRQYYHVLGEEVLKMHLRLNDHPVKVKLSKALWQKHTDLFSQQFLQVKVQENESARAIVLRHGLNAVRIASILTVLRYCEGPWEVRELFCTEQDFDTAIQIVMTSLHHCLLLNSSLPASVEKPKKMHRINSLSEFFGDLPAEFSSTQFMEECDKRSVSVPTAKRWLGKMAEQKLIERVRHGVYRKMEASQSIKGK